jgi:hypothetical protein
MAVGRVSQTILATQGILSLHTQGSAVPLQLKQWTQLKLG